MPKTRRSDPVSSGKKFARIPLEIELKQTKQVSNDLFCQFQTCRICILFRVRAALDVPVASVAVQSNIYGEFDPGSGRTLAACLTHASRTMKEACFWISGERVSNT